MTRANTPQEFRFRSICLTALLVTFGLLVALAPFAAGAQARTHHSGYTFKARISKAQTRGAQKRSTCRNCHQSHSSTHSASPVSEAAPATTHEEAPTPKAPETETKPKAPETKPAPETEAVAPSVPVSSPSTSSSVYLGATVGASVYGETSNPPWNMKPLETFEAHTGHKVAILQVHQEWGNIYPDVLQKIQARGAVPMLITEYNTLSQINNGSQDAKIKAMNAALTSYGGPVLFRWDWEMNGDWYPWGGASKAPEWVAAYRHLHDLITAPNVSWVWNPNIYFPGAAPGKGVPVDPTPWYPGSAYVDWMGADGYSYNGESFSSVFEATYKLFQKLAPDKPIILPEWAASNNDGQKASFIKEAFELTPTRYPAIKAMVYFNDNAGDGMDWPLEDLAAAGSAYKAGAAKSYFSAMPNLTGKLAIP